MIDRSFEPTSFGSFNEESFDNAPRASEKERDEKKEMMIIVNTFWLNALTLLNATKWIIYLFCRSHLFMINICFFLSLRAIEVKWTQVEIDKRTISIFLLINDKSRDLRWVFWFEVSSWARLELIKIIFD